ncbi:hypothetical protein [Pseudomonas glycinae]|uniref:hypothetical protein n=1 Tax=Pseudomonas glycinae TaxID=1785145 RepID=UPI001F32504E|nr:hypothetical protein [Pseudomonas glycinae]
MNVAIKRASFAPGNFFNASAYPASDIEDFVATSRLIAQEKVGPEKVEAIHVTAIHRPGLKTRASKSQTAREINILMPANLALGNYILKTRHDVDFSFKDAELNIFEGVSGEIKLEPAQEDENVRGSFQVEVEDPRTEGKTFLLKGQFQVLKKPD